MGVEWRPDKNPRQGTSGGVLAASRRNGLPSLIVLDPEGKERYRFEGYLPADDFLAQLETGLAKAAFAREDFAESERLYRDIVQQFPISDSAPEALYWAGVSKYKASHDPAPLADTARVLKERYPESSWTKKASVWAA